MKFVFTIFIFLGLVSDNLKKAGRINNTARQAARLYQEGAYSQAATYFRFLHDSLHVTDDQLLLNLAHAAFQEGDNKTAQKYYTRLVSKPDSEIRSVALTQLGILFFQQERPEKALYYFKKAIIQNHQNQSACYNYELVKKYLAQRPAPSLGRKRESPPQKGKQQETTADSPASPAAEGNEGSTPDNNTPGSNKAINNSDANGMNEAGNAGKKDKQDEQLDANGSAKNTPSGPKGDKKGIAEGENNINTKNNKAGTDQAGEQSRQMQTLRTRLRNTDLSPEKAKMLLDAMQQAELQYLQQVPKKSNKNTDKSKPDW